MIGMRGKAVEMMAYAQGVVTSICPLAVNKYEVVRGVYDTTFFTLEYDNTFYICFQGTTDLDDLARDARFNLVDFPIDRGVPRVHAGFRGVYTLIEREVTHFVALNNDKQIVFCGHSLGGALAQMFGAVFEHIDPEVITCGAPRVGDFTFAMLVPNHTRIVHRGDIVPSCPPWWLGYAHGEESVMKVGRRGWFKRLTPHFMDSYWEEMCDEVNPM